MSGAKAKSDKSEWTETSPVTSETASLPTTPVLKLTEKSSDKRDNSAALKKARAARKKQAQRGLPDFMAPGHPKNSLKPMWWIPSAERLVALLRKEYGDVKAVLNKATRNEKEHSRLLFSINERLTAPGNEQHLADWERLKSLYDMTLKEQLKQKVYSDILKMEEGQRKTKLSDFKFFMAQEPPQPTVKKKSVKEKEQEAAQAHIMNELKAITRRMAAPASTETEEPECLEADDSD